MRCFAKLSFVLFITSCVAIAGEKGTHDFDLVTLVTNLDKLHRVTEKPHPMADSTILFCRPPDGIPHNPHDGYVKPTWCNVYVNELARKTMLSGQGDYPVGSLIVKSKLPSREKPDIEFFTVMRKMSGSYDPKHGNWEYSIVDGSSQRVYASGKIESCISCHEAYKETDYVTRVYMQRSDKADNAPVSQLP